MYVRVYITMYYILFVAHFVFSRSVDRHLRCGIVTKIDGGWRLIVVVVVNTIEITPVAVIRSADDA